MKIPDLCFALLLLLISPLLCQGSTTPISGSGIEIFFDELEHDTQGIVTTAVMGGRDTDGGILLPITKGSQMTYDRTGVKGGSIFFSGGIQFTKGASKMVLSQFALDLKTGYITVQMDATLNILFGAIDSSSGEVDKKFGTTKVTLSLAYLNLNPAVLPIINKQLRTTLQVRDVHPSYKSGVYFDVDFVLGSKINTDLAAALGLDDYSDVNESASDFQYETFNTTITL